MKVKALTDFGGQYAMFKGSEAELPDNPVTKGLVKGGFIKVVGDEPEKPEKGEKGKKDTDGHEEDSEDSEEKSDASEEQEIDLHKLTNPELYDLRKEKGISVKAKAKKKDLIAALEAQE